MRMEKKKNHYNITSLYVDQLSRGRKTELLKVLSDAITEKRILFHSNHKWFLDKLKDIRQVRGGEVLMETVDKRVILLALQLEEAFAKGLKVYYVLRITDSGVLGVGDDKPFRNREDAS